MWRCRRPRSTASVIRWSAMLNQIALESEVPRERGRIYYGWVVLIVAAAAMVGTFPGRSIGRGLITEPLLADLRLDRVAFSWITLAATLAGSVFSLACGPLVDRLGTRVVLAANALLLGTSVVAMSRVESRAALAATLTLTLGLGQSALSAVSLSVVGKWFAADVCGVGDLTTPPWHVGCSAFPPDGRLSRGPARGRMGRRAGSDGSPFAV